MTTGAYRVRLLAHRLGLVFTVPIGFIGAVLALEAFVQGKSLMVPFRILLTAGALALVVYGIFGLLGWLLSSKENSDAYA